MKISYKAGDAAALDTPALAVFLFSEDKPSLTGRPELAGLRQAVGPRLKAGDYRPDHLSVLTLFPDRSIGPERIILVGLGSKEEYGPDKLRPAAARAVQAARDLNLKSAAMCLPPARAGHSL